MKKGDLNIRGIGGDNGGENILKILISAKTEEVKNIALESLNENRAHLNSDSFEQDGVMRHEITVFYIENTWCELQQKILDSIGGLLGDKSIESLKNLSYPDNAVGHLNEEPRV